MDFISKREPSNTINQSKDLKKLQDLTREKQQTKRRSLDTIGNPKNHCLQRIFSNVTQYEFITTNKQLLMAETMMIKLRAQIIQYPKSLQGIMKFNSQFQTHLAKIFQTNDSGDDGIAPLGRQLIGAHRGTKSFQDKMSAEIDDLNAVFKQWFVGFNNCKVKLKERDKCLKEFMHYFNKLPKLKLISASQNTLKGNSKINRNQQKFKNAEVKLKRVHQDSYEMMTQILKNRFVLINPCVLRFVRTLRRYYSGCGGIFAQFVEDKYDKNQFDIPEADRLYNASVVGKAGKKFLQNGPSYSFVLSKAQVQEDGQIGGFKFSGFNNDEKKEEEEEDEGEKEKEQHSNDQIKNKQQSWSAKIDEEVQIIQKRLSVKKPLQKLDACKKEIKKKLAPQSLAFRLSNNQVNQNAEDDKKNQKSQKNQKNQRKMSKDVKLDDFNSNLPAHFARFQFEREEEGLKFEFDQIQKPKQQPINEATKKVSEQGMTDSQNQKIIPFNKKQTDQQLQKGKKIGFLPQEPIKQPPKLIMQPKTKIQTTKKKKEPSKKQKKQQKQKKEQEFNALPAHFKVFKNEQLPNYQQYKEEKKTAQVSMRDQYFNGNSQPAIPVYDYNSHTYKYDNDQQNDNHYTDYQFNDGYSTGYNVNDNYQDNSNISSYNKYNNNSHNIDNYNDNYQSQQQSNFRLKYIYNGNQDDDNSQSMINEQYNGNYHSHITSKFDQGLAYAAEQPFYNNEDSNFNQPSQPPKDYDRLQRKATIKDENGHIARFGGMLSNPQFQSVQEGAGSNRENGFKQNWRNNIINEFSSRFGGQDFYQSPTMQNTQENVSNNRLEFNIQENKGSKNISTNDIAPSSSGNRPQLGNGYQQPKLNSNNEEPLTSLQKPPLDQTGQNRFANKNQATHQNLQVQKNMKQPNQQGQNKSLNRLQDKQQNSKMIPQQQIKFQQQQNQQQQQQKQQQQQQQQQLRNFPPNQQQQVRNPPSFKPPPPQQFKPPPPQQFKPPPPQQYKPQPSSHQQPPQINHKMPLSQLAAHSNNPQKQDQRQPNKVIKPAQISNISLNNNGATSQQYPPSNLKMPSPFDFSSPPLPPSQKLQPQSNPIQDFIQLQTSQQQQQQPILYPPQTSQVNNPFA